MYIYIHTYSVYRYPHTLLYTNSRLSVSFMSPISHICPSSAPPTTSLLSDESSVPSSTSQASQWRRRCRRLVANWVWIHERTLPPGHLPFCGQPWPWASGCWGGATGGAVAARPAFLTCGRTPRTRTACCVAPCRRTTAWCCGSSSCGTPGSSAA